jgi:hypothetical protein
MKIGDRARFTGKDTQFHNGEREGRLGDIVADANEDDKGSDWGAGTCYWRPDGGDGGWYVTKLADLTLEKPER